MNKTTVARQGRTANSLPPHQGILQRQCACGNHTIAGGECAECAKNKSGLQRKLVIGASHDPLEREADRVADQVLAAPAHSAVRGTPPRIQRFPGQAIGQMDAVPTSVDRVLASSGRPLDPALQQDMGQRFGHDFSQVRVHIDSESADAVNARAYTHGQHIVFATGQYPPDSSASRRLLVHELAHTIQQSGAATAAVATAGELSAAPAGSISRQETTSPSPPAGGGQPVYVCTKPILGSTLHRQGHAFFRVGGSTPGHPTYELEHARSCYCGWQGWPRRDVPEDRDAEVPCVPTPINSATLAANWNSYPVGQYCARGPNSNTYVRVMSAMCGSTVRPPGNTAGYDANPPAAGGAGAPHPYLSVVTCWSVDCDDTECGLIPGINTGIVPGQDPEALNAPSGSAGLEEPFGETAAQERV
jgi:Domain of unknown function (DUF4157)